MNSWSYSLSLSPTLSASRTLHSIRPVHSRFEWTKRVYFYHPQNKHTYISSGSQMKPVNGHIISIKNVFLFCWHSKIKPTRHWSSEMSKMLFARNWLIFIFFHFFEFILVTVSFSLSPLGSKFIFGELKKEKIDDLTSDCNFNKELQQTNGEKWILQWFMSTAHQRRQHPFQMGRKSIIAKQHIGK